MKRTIENEVLAVSVADYGAELVSIWDKVKNREVLWQADPAFWARHAPILFPQVGKSYGGYFTYQGKQYPTSQHGFARDCAFAFVEQTTDRIVHRLTASEETREKYPFSFELTVTHTLRERDILVQWHVANAGDNKMYFTIGGHPAFRVPVLPDTAQTEYTLRFHRDDLHYYLLDTDSGTANTDVLYSLPVSDGACAIPADLFAKDALLFDHQIDWAGIALPDGTPYVSVSCPGFPNFGIWSKPDAPFICLEPWDGRCDNTGFAGEISEKPGILSLAPNGSYEKEYCITIH
ncbi:MAG: aldose 1-epimerase family protein [Eubacteriales bacterium]|nr:aldose 1-epimerase family protein [Eubacteriales bacterium]